MTDRPLFWSEKASRMLGLKSTGEGVLDPYFVSTWTAEFPEEGTRPADAKDR